MGVVNAGAVKQVHASAIGRLRQRLHARDERRDANSSANPDLPLVPALKVKAAVRAFHHHHVVEFHPLGQRAGVVPQGFDDEGQAAIIRPGG